MEKPVTEQVADVLYEHDWGQDGDPAACRCGWKPPGDHVDHVAEALMTAFDIEPWT